MSLERNRWNGAVEARIVLRSLSPTLDGHVREIGGQALPEAIEHELGCDAQAWWDHGAEGAPTARDRRGESFAGVAGELLLSGEPVLVVVADAPRRAKGLAPVVAGIAGAQGLSIVEWECLARDPALAGPYSHLLALDPPPVPEGTGLLTGAAAGAGALAHVAWGEAEREFALACWRDRLALRPALAELWRTLARRGELSGEELERALCGDAPTPRGGRLCGRLVRVLCELGLAAYEPGAAHRLRAASDARTELDRSPAFRAYAARLAQAERHLASSAPDARKAAA